MTRAVEPDRDHRSPRPSPTTRRSPRRTPTFMRQGWGDRELDLPAHPIADARRRAAAAAGRGVPGRAAGAAGRHLQGALQRHRLPVPARQRHLLLTGDQTPTTSWSFDGGEATLFARPRSSRDTDEFYRDRRYGELWVGPPSAREEIAAALVIDGAPPRRARRGSGRRGQPACCAALDARVDELVATDDGTDGELARVHVRDAARQGRLRDRRDRGGGATSPRSASRTCVRDWADVARRRRALDRGHLQPPRARRGQRRRLRHASCGGGPHATTLHWIATTARSAPASCCCSTPGSRSHELYTADVTRTLPVGGRSPPRSARLRGGAVARRRRHRGGSTRGSLPRPAPRRDGGARGSAARVGHLELLPVPRRRRRSDPEAPGSTGAGRCTARQPHARHRRPRLRRAPATSTTGTACSRQGMVLTIEPGLYFQADDLLVPARSSAASACGSRTTSSSPRTAAENLSAALPTDLPTIEAWMAALRG